MAIPTILAFDNTDGPDGGCTTHMTFRVLLALPELALAGMPRLVRLNPNIPWKTRGNAAVALPLGTPLGPAARVGELQGHHIQAFPDGGSAESGSVLERAWDVLVRHSEAGAEPGVVLFDEAPPEAAYWQAVQSLVEPEEARALVEACGGRWRAHEGERALPGCLGAAAWRGPPSSYEFLAYREAARMGSPRAVDATPLQGLDGTGATFHTWDPEEGRLACVPHTPDPVLAGLRGRDPEALKAAALAALPMALGEPVDAWLLWATNQASGDHVVHVASVAEAGALATVFVAGRVTGAPTTRAGGHVFVALTDDAGIAFEAVAFEPTKGFRAAVRALYPGDEVEVVGALSPGPNPLVKLEKLHLRNAAIQLERPPNPSCPTCGRSLKSAGVGQGLRCRTCKTRAPLPDAKPVSRPPPGWHEVPVMARRHLHRPLAFGDG
ncbi:MAG: TiaS agmantine-binding domain-containing protein [Thermoplasmatota archaeon]